MLAGVPLALLRRAMAFRTVALQGLVAALLAQGVAIALALLGGGVWALVAQLIVTQWVIGLLAWRSAHWLPSFLLSPAQFRDMAAFGLHVSGVDVVATLRNLAESWIVAVTLGTPALGLLNISIRLIQVAQELTAASLIPVSTVVFARVRQSADRLRDTYLKALGVAYAVVSPVMILIVVTAPVSIPLLFGSRWGGSVLPAQALAVAGIITLGAMLDHGLFYGLGRPGAWLAYAVVVDMATVATTAVAVRWGLAGVAVGFVGVAFAATAARWVLVGRLLTLPLRPMGRPFLTVLVPTVVVGRRGQRGTRRPGRSRPARRPHRGGCRQYGRGPRRAPARRGRHRPRRARRAPRAGAVRPADPPMAAPGPSRPAQGDSRPAQGDRPCGREPVRLIASTSCRWSSRGERRFHGPEMLRVVE